MTVQDIVDSKGKLVCRLPCGHYFIPNGKWEETGNVSNKTLRPSIQCMGEDGKACWHGYLTDGEYITI